MLALAVLAAPAKGVQDVPEFGACPQISRIFIDNHSIFDLSKIEESGRLGWAFRLVNRLHYRTTENFIRRELLFETGDCLDLFLVDESARLLRQYKFFAEADAFAVQQPDGSHHVVVETKDEWTTKLDIGASFDDGFQLEKVELTEENFLGRGLEVDLFFQERRERRDAGVRLRTTRLFGTRTDGRFEYGQTRVGRFGTFEVAYPFVGEEGRWALYQTYDRRESLFSYSVPEVDASTVEGLTNVVLPMEVERFAVGGALRAGLPGDLRMAGLVITHESVRFPGHPGSVELVVNGDFGNTLPAGDSIEGIVNPQIREAWKTRFNAIFGWRRLRFARRRSLDSMRGIQDVELGSDMAVTFGFSPGNLGSGGVDVTDDMFTRVELYQGLELGETLIAARLRSDGRLIFSDGAFSENWQDVHGEADLYFYWLPTRWDRHTIFARVSGTGSWDARFPYQLTLGGRETVRGFSSDRFPGGRRVVASLEDRIGISWPRPDLLDVGFTLFVDTGRMWAGDAPFGEDTGWKTSIGAGLRLGFPAESRGTVRLDLALPLGEGGGLSDVVFRVSLREFLGLLRGFDDEQSVRSRLVGVGADIFQPGR